MPDRIEELFAELAESAGGQQQFQLDQQLEQMEAERDYYNSPEGKQAAAIAGGLGLLALTRGGLGGKNLPPTFLNKLYGQVGQDFTKLIPPLTKIGRSGRVTGGSGSRVGTDVAGRSELGRLIFGPLTQTGRSGSRVGTDVVGRYALPKTKPSVVTKQGPRGPINIDVPKQRSLPLEDPRYTKGISATERAQLPTRRLSKPKWVRDPYYPLEAKNVPEALTKASLNRGRPYPGPHLTAEEGLKKLVPLRLQGKVKEATWYQHPRTGELYQYHYGAGALARGFYKRGKDAGGTPQHARRAAEEFNPNVVGARTPTKGGGITATRAADKIRAEIAKQERWKRGHQNKVRRGNDEYQEGSRSGYEPGIKGGEKMMRDSMKRIREIQAKIDKLNKLLE